MTPLIVEAVDMFSGYLRSSFHCNYLNNNEFSWHLFLIWNILQPLAKFTWISFLVINNSGSTDLWIIDGEPIIGLVLLLLLLWLLLASAMWMGCIEFIPILLLNIRCSLLIKWGLYFAPFRELFCKFEYRFIILDRSIFEVCCRTFWENLLLFELYKSNKRLLFVKSI